MPFAIFIGGTKAKQVTGAQQPRRAGIMTAEKLEKVLEKLAVTDKATLVVAQQPDGKIRVTSGSWDGKNVILRDRVLEVRNANSDGRPHIARKLKSHDEWEPAVEVYDPYGPGVTGNALM
jgi:hypothetical protein